MKVSRKFAPPINQSHYLAKMANVSHALVLNVTSPEDVPIIILQLVRRDTSEPHILKLRMTVEETRRLVSSLERGIRNAEAPGWARVYPMQPIEPTAPMPWAAHGAVASMEEIAKDRAALTPEERAVLDALPDHTDGYH